MKLFEVTLTNGAIVKFRCDDYNISTSEKGQITNVNFFEGAGEQSKIIGVVSGTTFSHIEISELPDGSQ